MKKTFEAELEDFLEKYRDHLTLKDQEPRQHVNNCTFLAFSEGYSRGQGVKDDAMNGTSQYCDGKDFSDLPRLLEDIEKGLQAVKGLDKVCGGLLQKVFNFIKE